MNYFAHGRRFVADPFFLAGTALPDWLSVVDRRVRVRSKHAAPHVQADDPRLARLAAGVVQHHHDDGWFHESRAFSELSLTLCILFRDRLPRDDGFRPHFLGHILVEILLDAALIADDPPRLAAYYDALASLDPAAVEDVVTTIRAGSGTTAAAPPAVLQPGNLATFVGLFIQERFLEDYADDAKLLWRLNQVMRRVGLPTLPAETASILAEARELVYPRKDELADFGRSTV